MAFPTSATQRKSATLQTIHHPAEQSKPAAVTALAGSRLNGASNTTESSNSPTTSQQPLRFCLKRSFESVNKRTDEGKCDEARVILEKINTNLQTIIKPKDCLSPVLYLLGLAYTYPVGSKERTENAGKAYQALKRVCQNNEAWKAFEAIKKSIAYRNLKSCYERLKPLFPESETAAHQDIDQKIKECNPLILPMQTFNAKVYEADRCVRQKNHEKAGMLYTEALNLIEGISERNLMLPKVLCILKYANICEAPDMKLQLSHTAKETLFKFYESRESFFNTDWSNKTDVFKQLHTCFLELAKLVPETETDTHSKIQSCIEDCEEEFTPEPPTPMPNKTQKTKDPASVTTNSTPDPKKTEGPKEPPKKYTRGSSGNRSSRIFRIFALLALAAVAVAGVVFYRRNIVKVE